MDVSKIEKHTDDINNTTPATTPSNTPSVRREASYVHWVGV